MTEFHDFSLQVLIICCMYLGVEFSGIYCFLRRCIFVNCILVLHIHLFINENITVFSVQTSHPILES